jgi:hypothetical protein
VAGVFVFGKGFTSQSNVEPVITDASWSDKVFLSGGTFPAYVDLHFHTEGFIDISGLGAGAIEVHGGSFRSEYTFATLPFTDQISNAAEWDTLSFGGGSFGGTWHERVFSNGGEWDIGYDTRAEIFGPTGASSTNLNGADPPTFSFTAVTLPDGRTPESEGFTVQFESGIASPNAVAVPEPSSLTLFGVATATFAGYFGRRRRKRPVAA